MFIAAVTPLSMAAKLVGSLLGGAVAGAGLTLLMRSRSRSSDPPAHDFAQRIEQETPWRRPNAILMTATGILIWLGVWIDPAVYPIAFVSVWMGILVATMAMMSVAIHDLLFVRKRALQDRLRLIEQNRSELEHDLKEYFRSKAHKNNGSAPNDSPLQE